MAGKVCEIEPVLFNKGDWIEVQLLADQDPLTRVERKFLTRAENNMRFEVSYVIGDQTRRPKMRNPAFRLIRAEVRRLSSNRFFWYRSSLVGFLVLTFIAAVLANMF